MAFDRHVLEIVIDLLHQLHNIYLTDIQMHFTSYNAADIQKLVYQRKHPPGIFVYKIHAVFVRVSGLHFASYIFYAAQYECQRSPELVRDIGEEPSLDFIQAVLQGHVVLQFHGSDEHSHKNQQERRSHYAIQGNCPP